MLNLKSAVTKPSISAAIRGLHLLKMCVLAKPIRAQHKSKSFMGNLIQRALPIDYKHISSAIPLRLQRLTTLLDNREGAVFQLLQ